MQLCGKLRTFVWALTLTSCVLVPALMSVPCSAQQRVRGYTRSDGTVVRSYTRRGPVAADSRAAGYEGTYYGTTSTADIIVYNPSASSGHAIPPRTIVVGGYFRKDGTYVRPHLRTVPDGIEWNNLSYHEDRDQPGAPPGTFSPTYLARNGFKPPQSLADQEDRLRLIDEIARYGFRLDWQRHTVGELARYSVNARIVDRLRRLGIEVDVRRATREELLDLECAAISSEELARLGVAADPDRYDCLTLQDWLARIRLAREIAALGRTVDWREHSLGDLAEIKAKLQP
jgi:hypothetical protein